MGSELDEKLFLMHEEFQKPTEKIRVDRLSRHLYDVEKLMQTEFIDLDDFESTNCDFNNRYAWIGGQEPVDSFIIEKVYFENDGIFESVKKGSVLIDMTTTEPSLAVEIYNRGKEIGVDSIDAPVSGGDVGAKNGTLAVMAGGEEAVFNAVYPLFEVMGKNIIYQGGAGTGQHTKMCNQITISGIMIGVCEALLYAHKAGLDLQVMIDTIKGGAAACWSLDNYAPRILKGDYDPGFMVEHFIKDMGIALDEAKKMGLFLPGLSLVHQLYVSLKAIGYGKYGTHSLILALDKLSGSSFSNK